MRMNIRRGRIDPPCARPDPLRATSIEAGFRAALIDPLLSSDGPPGTLVLQRRRPGEFPEACAIDPSATD
jgi:hypothetical protein